MRAASSSALASAAAGDPPPSITPIAANCDAPVNTSSDMAQAWSTERPDAVASTPNDTPNTPTASPSVTAPLRGEGRFTSGGSGRP